MASGRWMEGLTESADYCAGQPSAGLGAARETDCALAAQPECSDH
jgi:hypothetical protein